MSLRPFALVAVAGLLLPPVGQSQTPDEKAALAVVQRLFEGMRTADTALVRASFAEGARFALIDARNTPPAIRYESVDGWIRAIGNSARRWDEQIYDVQVRVDGDIAQVWAPYTFYLDKKVRHCGVDAIALLRVPAGWHITQLSDTQRREGCPDPLAK